MRFGPGLLAVVLSACGFRVEIGTVDADTVQPDRPDSLDPDAAPDADVTVDAARPRFCEPIAPLQLCFSFDQDPLPGTLANEGSVAVDATLRNITRVTSAQGGAAQFETDSAIIVPDTDVEGIVSLETWFRIDTLPASDGARQGILDSNTNPNISLFVYRQSSSYALRCGLGAGLVTFSTSALTAGTWHYVACSCDGVNLAVYLDGVSIGSLAAACTGGGSIVGDAFTIGSDNRADPQNIGERIEGAIDGVRLWSTPLSATQVCQRAGRTGC
ncbi:MAG: LamG domain-containing protein [Kofleriaceae bacterium]|nr:LamG domain-containing protein [Kofleriaceae bacterium]